MIHGREQSGPRVAPAYMPARAGLLAALFIGLIALAKPAPLFSQEAVPGSTVRTGSTVAAPPLALPEGVIGLSTLFDEADKSERDATQLAQKVTAPPPEVKGPEELKDRIGRSRDQILREAAGNILSFDRLDQRITEWNNEQQNVDAKSKALGGQISAIQQAQADVAASKQKWRKTLEFYKTAGYAQTSVERVNAALAGLDKASSTLDAMIGPLLTAQEKLSQERTLINDHLDFMAESRKILAGSRWLKDRPSIFEAAFYNRLHGVNLSDLEERWNDYLSQLQQYYQTVKGRLAVEIMVLMALWLWLRTVLVRIRKGFGEMPEMSEDLRPPFEHPFSIALLLVSLPAPLLFPNAPLLARDLFMLMLVFPVADLLIHLIAEQRLKHLILGMAATHVIGLFRDLLIGSMPLDRIALICQAAFGLAVIIFTLTPLRLVNQGQDMRPHKLWSRIRIVEIVLIILLGLVLIGQLLGFNRASAFLGQGTFRTIYITLFIIAIYRLLRSLFIYMTSTNRAQKLNMIKERRQDIVFLFGRWLGLAAIIVWIYFLSLIWELDSLMMQGLRAAWGLGVLIGEFHLTPGVVISAVIAIYASIQISRLLTFVLDKEVYPHSSMQPGLKEAINQGVKYLLVFIGFVAALSTLGVKLSNLAIIAGALGVGVGFGLQNIVNNFLSGLIILVERPIKVGDVLEIEGMWGVVKHIGIRATLIETWDQSELILPNGDLLWSKLTNWTHSNGLNRISITAGVAYGSDPEAVIELLAKAAKDHPEVMTTPAPLALLTGFGNSSLDFELRVYLPSIEGRLRVASELRTAIYQALAEAGIEIPFPQRDLHIRGVTGPAMPRTMKKADGDQEKTGDPRGKDGSEKPSPQ